MSPSTLAAVSDLLLFLGLFALGLALGAVLAQAARRLADD